MSARVSPLGRDEIGPEVAEQISASFPRSAKFFAPSGAPPMPPVLGLLAQHPGLAGPWLGFSGALLDGGVLDARTRELLILATARRTDASYVWEEHLSMAREAGLTNAEIDAIDTDGAGGWSATDVALLRAVDELTSRYRVSDDTWATLDDHFDDQALLEILLLVGAYCCLAMVLNSNDLKGTERSE